jgi:hypothetical protein
MVPLVRAAAALEAEDIPPVAVIGGVAVTVRLGTTLRATAGIAAANPSLARVVARTVRQHLVTGASRARSVLVTSNDARYQVITAEEISYAAVAFLRRARRALTGRPQPDRRHAPGGVGVTRRSVRFPSPTLTWANVLTWLR